MPHSRTAQFKYCPHEGRSERREGERGGGGGLEEFMTVQTQTFSFFGKFVTRGRGVRKSRFFCVK